MAFYDIFIYLCKQRGKSPSAVAREIGLNDSSTTYWKRGSIPKSDTVQKLADYFCVSTDYLLDVVRFRPAKPPTDAELDEEMWAAYELLDHESKLKAVSRVSELASTLGVYADEPLGSLSAISFHNKMKLINLYSQLSIEGQQEAVKRIEELTQLPQYQSSSSPSAPAPTPDTPEPQDAAEGGSEPKKDN